MKVFIYSSSYTPALYAREVLIRRVYPTGVQTVERENARYFLTIRNGPYMSEHEVPIETARRYYYALCRQPTQDGITT